MSRDTAPLRRHERYEAHVQSVAFNDARMALRKTDQSRCTVLSMMDDAHSKTVEENRQYLRTVCEILRLTAMQKIAQRETGSMYRVSNNEHQNLSLSESIIEIFQGIGVNFDQCVWQGYDGASVMKGNLSGVNAIIEEKVSPMAN